MQELRSFRAKVTFTNVNKKDSAFSEVFCLPQRRPTFPGSCPPSIIGTAELNYCVRNGYRCVLCVIVTEYQIRHIFISSYNKLSNPFWTSPRSISIGQLNTLLHLHLRPINHIVYMGPYYLSVWDILSRGGLHA